MQLSTRRPVGAPMSPLAATVLLGLLTWGATSAQAADDSLAQQAQAAWQRITDTEAWQGDGHWRAIASPYTLHWRPSDEHRHVYALGLERQSSDHWLLGASYFRNSFGQPSAYTYLGRRSDGVLAEPKLFFQWSVGVLYGYKGKYKSKVPLNLNGFAPGGVVSLGWQFDARRSVALHALGDAGVMIQLGYDWR